MFLCHHAVFQRDKVWYPFIHLMDLLCIDYNLVVFNFTAELSDGQTQKPQAGEKREPE